MRIHEDPQNSRAYPERWCCRIEIATKSGRTHRAAVEHFKGHPDNPLTDTELARKFQLLAAPRLDRQKADAVLARLWALDW